jgi:pimeloyl-ACP methyl ester carboxylesterase
MDMIARRAEAELNVHATSLANQEWQRLVAYITVEHQSGRWYGPLVLVGHSYGCDDQVRVSKRLNEQKIPVDLLILVDPTTPGSIPPNVKRCVDIYKSHPGTDILPFFRGIKVRAVDPSRTLVTNIDLRLTDVGFSTRVIDHFNIAKIKGVQDMVLSEISKTCLPRAPAQPPARTAVR